MLKEKTITFGELEKQLLELGFDHSCVDGSYHVFKHLPSDTVIALPDYAKNDQVRPIHILTVNKFLSANGLKDSIELE